MPPLLAFLVCTAFVVFLLLLERGAGRDTSAALWIPTIWILMIGSRSLGGWFGAWSGSAGNNDAGNLADQLVLSSLSIAAILVLARRRFKWSRTLRRHKWLLALLAYMFVSTLWSDITFVAMKRWVRVVIVLIMALLTMSEANPRQALESVLRRSGYILIPFSLVLIKYYPVMGRQYGPWSGIEMWTGVTSQKNQLGRLCMITIFFLSWALYRRWRGSPQAGGRYQAWADVSVLLIAVYLLKGSTSSTSWATLVLGAAAFLGLRLFRTMKLAVPQTGLLALVIFLIAFGVSTPFLGGSTVADFTDSLGRDKTLTGRTEVWSEVLPAMRQRSLLGYGFGSFWTDARRQLYDIPTAHNGYLDILLELGEVGLAFYTIWLLSCARQLRRALAQDYDWASLAICFLLMSLVYNTTESALNSLTEHMTAVIVLASFVLAYEPMPMGNPANSRTASARHEATGVGTAADWHAPETWPEFTRNS